MAGEIMFPTLIARAVADLLPGVDVLGGGSRNAGVDLCPSGH
jgi:hypothetical protein